MGIVGFALRLPHTFYVLASLILFLGLTAIAKTNLTSNYSNMIPPKKKKKKKKNRRAGRAAPAGS